MNGDSLTHFWEPVSLLDMWGAWIFTPTAALRYPSSPHWWSEDACGESGLLPSPSKAVYPVLGPLSPPHPHQWCHRHSNEVLLSFPARGSINGDHFELELSPLLNSNDGFPYLFGASGGQVGTLYFCPYLVIMRGPTSPCWSIVRFKANPEPHNIWPNMPRF